MQELTQELKDSLKKPYQCLQVQLDVKKISEFSKQFGKYFFRNQKWANTNDKMKKTIFLQKPIPLELEEYIKNNNIETNQQELYLTYKDLTYNEVLEQLIPVPPPQGFEMVGKIAHFNLSAEQIPYKTIIGQVLLDKNKQIETVCNKTEKLHNVYRTPQLELMAGKASYDAIVSEADLKLHLNFEEVYWCTRLYSERERVIKLIKKLTQQPKILDLFCGIGPFALRVSKELQCVCYANDLNPQCYKFLKKNIIVNNLTALVTPFNLDAKDVLIQIYDKVIDFHFDHVYMNLPVLAIDFLCLFKGFTKKTGRKDLPFIHVYGFAKGMTDEELIDAVTKRIQSNLPGFKKEHIIEFHVLKNVTKLKKMTCTSFQLDEISANMEFNPQLNLDQVDDEQEIQDIEQNYQQDQQNKQEDIDDGVMKKVKI